MKLLLIRMTRFTRTSFWREAATLDDSATRLVLPGVILFGLVSALICIVEYYSPPSFTVTVDVTVYEIGGAILGLLLVIRTNEGLSRWWEARRLWGGIVNQSRNFALAALAYGPSDSAWRAAAIRWSVVFAHACRRSLRGEGDAPEIVALIGEQETARLLEADHWPSHVALVMARILRGAVDRLGMDRWCFLQIDKERATLIEHIGGCERILKTPMPKAYSIAIRRFIFLFLLLLPFGLIQKLDRNRIDTENSRMIRDRMWLTPLVTMLVAFPLLTLDRIGAEVQNPFSKRNLNHLDLDGITATIERNLFALLDGPVADVEVMEFLVDLDSLPNPHLKARLDPDL